MAESSTYPRDLSCRWYEHLTNMSHDKNLLQQPYERHSVSNSFIRHWPGETSITIATY